MWGGGANSSMDSALASHPAALGLILDIAKIYGWHCLEQWTEA